MIWNSFIRSIGNVNCIYRSIGGNVWWHALISIPHDFVWSSFDGQNDKRMNIFFLLFIVRKKWNKNFCNDLAAQKVIRHSIYHFFLGLKKNEIYDFFLSLSYIQDFFSNFYSGCCSFYSLLIWWLWNSKHDAGTIAILHKWDGTSSYGTACTLDYHFP